MKLRDIINGRQTVSLLHESDTHVALSLLDQRTGEAMRVDISADMVTRPDEALLYVEVAGLVADVKQDKDKQIDLAGWWAAGNMIGTTEDMWSYWSMAGVTKAEPLPAWTITPDGREIDLRAREGGLF